MNKLSQSQNASLDKSIENELLEKIALDFERWGKLTIISDEHSYNDCAVMAKMWFKSANAIREYKTNDPR